MNLKTFALNSSNVAGGFLHRLSEKELDFSAIIIKISTTFGFKFLIRTETNENLSMKSRSGSSSFYLMLASATTVRWCGMLVIYGAPKRMISVTNESMEFLVNRVYQWNVVPFNVVGNTRHMIVLLFINKLVSMVGHIGVIVVCNHL